MTTFDADTFESIQALDAEHGMQTYARLPVAFVRGEGSKLWDSEGGEYLDFLTKKGISPNVASFVGAATVRQHEIGFGPERE